MRSKRETKRAQLQADHILQQLETWPVFVADPETIIANASPDLVNRYEIAAQVQFMKKWLDRLARAAAGTAPSESVGTAEIIEFPSCRQR